MIGRFKNEVGVGCLIILAGALMMWVALQVGAFDFRKRIHVSSDFSNAAGLTVGAVVASAGVPIGSVESLELENGKARVVFGIYAAEKIPNAVGVRIRVGVGVGVRIGIRVDVHGGLRFLEPTAATAPEKKG